MDRKATAKRLLSPLLPVTSRASSGMQLGSWARNIVLSVSGQVERTWSREIKRERERSRGAGVSRRIARVLAAGHAAPDDLVRQSAARASRNKSGVCLTRRGTRDVGLSPPSPPRPVSSRCRRSPRAHSKHNVRARIGGYIVVRFSGDLGIGEYAKKSARDYPRWHVSRDGHFWELPSLQGKEGGEVQIELCTARVTASLPAVGRRREV